jgi:hypothetical protein
VHRVLKDHPQRAEILSKHPDLTCAARAREIAKGAKNGKDKDSKRWFANLVARSNEDIDEASIVDQRMTPAPLCDLLMVIEPELLEPVKAGAEARLKVYNFLISLCKEPPQAVLEELKLRAKANAAEADERERVERKRRAKEMPATQVVTSAQPVAAYC